MKFNYDSYCGLYCGACPFLTATQKGENNLKQLHEKISKKNKNIELRDLKCKGCKSQQHSIYCESCEIRECAEKRGIEYCYECSQYPCDFLKNFRNDDASHHSVIFKNLETIQMMGKNKWLENQKKRWQCDECGEEYTWYDKECQNCGNKLFNAVEEEELLEND